MWAGEWYIFVAIFFGLCQPLLSLFYLPRYSYEIHLLRLLLCLCSLIIRWSSLRILSWFNLCCGRFDWLPRFLFIFLFLIIIRKSPHPTIPVYAVTSKVPKHQIGSLNPNWMSLIIHSKFRIYSLIIFKHSCFLFLYSLFLYIYLFELSFPFRSVLSNF